MPQNAPLAAKTLWRTADAIWRAAGDKAVDFSYYTKRATVGAVYSATLLVWLNDESEASPIPPPSSTGASRTSCSSNASRDDGAQPPNGGPAWRDRKSTRLNSSH